AVSDGTGAVTSNPGTPTVQSVVLTKDWSNTSEWYKWRKAVLDGKVDRRSMSVIFLNDAGKISARMNFYNCWPVKWSAPELNARSSGHASEKLEISWETMELKAG
ncbi:MAG: phage tail protein, partial [Actinomycetota bacterium]